jgi:hypothetical protein
LNSSPRRKTHYTAYCIRNDADDALRLSLETAPETFHPVFRGAVIRYNSSRAIAQTSRAENSLVDPATALTGIGNQKPIRTTAGLHGGQRHIALCREESISPAGTRVATNSDGAFVTMMKTSDTRPRYDSPSPYAAPSLFRDLLLESTVDTIRVVIIDIRSEQPLQMHLVYRNHMVQQFAAATPHPALGNTVGEGRQLHRIVSLRIRPSRSFIPTTR